MLLEIRDDGRGFDPAARHPGHFGLESMRSRAAEIGGHPDDHERARSRARSSGWRSRPRREADLGWRLSRTTGSACWWSTITPSCAAGCLAFLDSEPDLEVVGDADGGAQALELLARLDAEGRRPDVVLMDLQMEPLDGIESTRQIRARYDDVEVVALTSFAEEERVHAALEAGASGYLLKDADADEVAAAVRAAHRGELQLDPAVARRLMSSLRAAPRDDLTEELTTRELEVLRLVGAGRANKEIAAELDISERTARTHVSNILGKLGLSSRTQAALWAVREGLVDVTRPRPTGVCLSRRTAGCRCPGRCGAASPGCAARAPASRGHSFTTNRA